MSTSSDSGLFHETEAICREYEASLREKKPLDLDRLLEKWRVRPWTEGLLVELLKLKIEHSLPSVQLPERYLFQTLVQDYPNLDEEGKGDLVAHEYLVRWLRGECLTVDRAVLRAGSDIPFIQKRLLRAISEASPVDVTVFEAETEKLQARLANEIVVGRQSRQDPAPFARLRFEDHDKLIIASTNARRISRRQLVLAFIAPSTIEVHNADRGAGVVYNAREELVPGKSVIIDADAILEFGEYALRLHFHGRGGIGGSENSGDHPRPIAPGGDQTLT